MLFCVLSVLLLSSADIIPPTGGTEWAAFIHDMAVKEPSGPWLKVCAGWSAQSLCSAIFGSGISETVARQEDNDIIFALGAESTVNYADRSVSSVCVINPFNSTNTPYKSIYRENLGCTLVERFTEAQIRAQNVGDQRPPAPLDPQTPWPRGEALAASTPPGMDRQCVESAVQRQFDLAGVFNPRAIVIVFREQLVFERYAPTVNRNSRLLGWSMTKSLTNALMGIVASEQRTNIFRPVTPQEVPEWYVIPGDARQRITSDMMLRMSAGTGSDQVYDILFSAGCLYASDANCGALAGSAPLSRAPDTLFQYDGGSTFLLSRIVNTVRGDRQFTNFEWPKRRLFYPIGAHSMYIEHAADQMFMGASLGFATARDWARFGLLYKRQGVWVDGNRILPADWVRYSSTTTPTAPLRDYAAQFWKKPNVDPAMFSMEGFRNQFVFILPRQDLVIVRLSMPQVIPSLLFNETDFLTDIMRCFPAAV